MKILIMVGVMLAFFIGLYLIDKLVEDINKKWQKRRGIKS